MPVAASDLIKYQSANMPEDDAAASGGAIDTAGRAVEYVQAADDDYEALSDNAADTMNLTLTARDTAGVIASETKALTGTTAVIFSTLGVRERLMKTLLASVAAGTITIRRSVAGANVVQKPAGTTKTKRRFYDSVSEAAQADRFEKTFWKNIHATLALTNALVTLTLDPALRMFIALANAKGDTESVTNRKTAPTGVGTFVDDNNDIAVPTGSLAAGETIGEWIRQRLPIDDSARKSTFTTKLHGSST